MRHQSAWTDERIATLGALAAQSLSAAEIAYRMETTRNTVIGAVRRFGIVLLRSPGKGLKSDPASQTANPKKSRAYRPRAPKPKPAPPRNMPRTDLPEPKSLRISLLGLSVDQCKWPSGETVQEITFCGAPQFAASDASWPYCEHHCARAYQIPTSV